MAIKSSLLQKWKKKYKHVQADALLVSDDGEYVEAYRLMYQCNGLPGRPSPGLMEVNALWDVRQDRPDGFFLMHTNKRPDGVAMSIMVANDLISRVSRENLIEKWDQDFLSLGDSAAAAQS